MNYYQDITLIGDPEISLGFLWQKVFQQVHFALVNNKTAENYSSIGAGFPSYGKRGFSLGDKLRLFAETKAELEALNIAKFLERLSDYVHIKSIAEVPKTAKAVTFVRRSIKGESRIEQEMQNKIARLQSRDESWFAGIGKSLEKCLADLNASKPEADSSLPFIWLESQETKKRNPEGAAKFPLFIEKIEAASPQKGKFSCYGLAIRSTEFPLATVPDF